MIHFRLKHQVGLKYIWSATKTKTENWTMGIAVINGRKDRAIRRTNATRSSYSAWIQRLMHQGNNVHSFVYICWFSSSVVFMSTLNGTFSVLPCLLHMLYLVILLHDVFSGHYLDFEPMSHSVLFCWLLLTLHGFDCIAGYIYCKAFLLHLQHWHARDNQEFGSI